MEVTEVQRPQRIFFFFLKKTSGQITAVVHGNNKQIFLTRSWAICPLVSVMMFSMSPR